MASPKRRTGIWVFCAVCDKRIYKEPSRVMLNRSGKYTCSRECKAIQHKLFWKERAEAKNE